ncbi:MAG TPA: phosphoribosylformylglycinamidine synthase subunit PurL [Armatimonadota bacterium]|jgi:phosphoribosylformylglycinamidine synthase
MGLTDHEYGLITQVLGKHPTYTELGMYAVMWSEHCGYKYSRPILRLFKDYKKAIDTGSMENAGVLPIGDGLGVVFKMESHNHPSAVEPFQGAATGVGGILRDIFTMGARPIASLDSLRFGDLDDPRVRFLFEGVVSGIAHYGNCVGVPTVGGEVGFNASYQGNPLVNAMAVGLVRMDSIASARAAGIGNPVLLVGAATGRDGIHACSVLASAELSEQSLANRPAVQAGDPFTEKLLIEATLEALATGFVVGIQDMGAAGITCSTCETSAKGGTGMRIDVLKVPRREDNMTPYEVMLSESQERMLCIVEKGHEDEVAAIFRKWELNAEHIGEVTDDGMVTVLEGGVQVARVPAKSLADECPTYQLETSEPAYIREVQGTDLSGVPEPADLRRTLLDLLASPNICDKSWVYRQYDHMVQTNTVVLPGSDASVLRVKGTAKGLGLAADCNGRYCYLDPYVGAQHAVAEAARNLSCSGARPLGVTDCLNFGNPEKPEAFWQFKRAVEGLADACEAFGLPVISGNVSFYNETPEHTIFPTPTIGMVGLLEDVEKRCTQAFRQEGDRVFLLGRDTALATDSLDGVGGSELLATIHGMEVGNPPSLDSAYEVALQAALREAIEAGLLSSAHDCSDGGLAVALAESCISADLGATVELPTRPDGRHSLALFSEEASRVVVSSPPARAKELETLAKARGVGLTALGEVGGKDLAIRLGDKGGLEAPVAELRDAWEGTVPCAMR